MRVGNGTDRLIRETQCWFPFSLCLSGGLYQPVCSNFGYRPESIIGQEPMGNFRGMGTREGQPGSGPSEGQGQEWKTSLSKAPESSGGLEVYA